MFATLGALSTDPAKVLGFSSPQPILAGLLVFTAAMLVMMFMVVSHRLRSEQQMKILRIKESHLVPTLTLRRGHTWMLFISHTCAAAPCGDFLVRSPRVYPPLTHAHTHTSPLLSHSRGCLRDRSWSTGQDQVL